jgi:hypothetical protein
LIRLIPVIYLIQGKLETIKMEQITLPPRELVYKEEAYAEQKENRLLANERKEFKEFGKVFAFGDDPLVQVEDAVKATGDFRVKSLWNKIKGELV